MFKWLVGVGIGAIFIVTGLQLVPVYINNHAVKTIAKDVVADGTLKGQPKREIMRAISTKFTQNDLTLNPENVVKVSKDVNGDLVLDVKYEERRPLFSNLEIVAGFDDQYTN